MNTQINVQHNQGRTYPTFKSRIEILEDMAFSQAKSQACDFAKYGNFNEQINYTMSGAVIKTKRAFTEQIRNCTYSSIINPKTKELNSYHLSPYEENLSKLKEIREAMLEQAFELRANSKSNLEGLITGANYSLFPTKDSHNLYKWIRGTFEEISQKIGMTFSDISGRKDIGTEIGVISDAEKNTHSLNLNPLWFDIKTPADVNNYFETKNIAKKDKLFLYQQNITKYF